MCDNKFAFDSSIDEDAVQDPRYDSSDWRVWKATIEKDMLDLRERVRQIEKKDFQWRSITKQGLEILSFANAENDGCAGLRTSAGLIRKKKAASFQFIWLVIFVVTVTVVGSMEFVHARDNRAAEFKPEKKIRTVNYADSNNDTPYEMPYIYIYFAVHNLRKTANETLEILLQSQNNFQNNVKVNWLDEDLYEQDEYLAINEVDAEVDKEYVEEARCFGFFRLKPSNPNPSIGPFTYEVSINMNDMTLALDKEVKVVGLWISLSKQDRIGEWENMVRVRTSGSASKSQGNDSAETQITATIDYREKVTHAWNGGEVTHITQTLTAEEEIEVKQGPGAANLAGLVTIVFQGNLMIDDWQEYVDYDYLDWFSSMGGMINLASMVFFWGAYYIARVFGDDLTMGILPEFSFVFYNLEAIRMLRDQVKTGL